MESHHFGEELFWGFRNEMEEVESRRRERATGATGLRTEAGSYMQQDLTSVQRDRV